MKYLYLPGDPESFANYVRAFAAVGVTVTNDEARCTALLLPGGADVDPARYGQENRGSVGIDLFRDEREWEALRRFAARELPVFGICRGHQLLNVFFGGTLHQDIPGHGKTDPAHDRIHKSRTDDPLLQSLFGESFPVNSAHHQSVDRPGDGFSAIQWAGDGTVEAARHETLPIFSVQWHPERLCGAFRRADAIDSAPLFRVWAERIPELMREKDVL